MGTCTGKLRKIIVIRKRIVMFWGSICQRINITWRKTVRRCVEQVWQIMFYLISSQLHRCDFTYSSFYHSQPLNCTIYGRELQLFCYITNSRIVENENGSATWSILVINSYDATFSNSLVLFAWQWSFLSCCLNWLRLFPYRFGLVLHNTNIVSL